jgi:hypothetical protein
MSNIVDMEPPMAFLEKSSWVVLVVAAPTLLVYLVLVVPQLADRPVTEVSWTGPMLGAMVGFVVANVLGSIVAAFTNPREADRSDERDRAIAHTGERVGNWLVAAGAIVALVLAMTGAAHFWIANAIFLGGIAGSVMASITKIAAYRGTVQAW